MEELITLIFNSYSSSYGGTLSYYIGSYSTEAFAIDGFIIWFEKKYAGRIQIIDKLKSCTRLSQINKILKDFGTAFSKQQIYIISHKINEVLFDHLEYHP